MSVRKVSDWEPADWDCSGQGAVDLAEEPPEPWLDAERVDWTCSGHGEHYHTSGDAEDGRDVLAPTQLVRLPESARARCLWHFAPVRQLATHLPPQRPISDR